MRFDGPLDLYGKKIVLHLLKAGIAVLLQIVGLVHVVGGTGCHGASEVAEG